VKRVNLVVLFFLVIGVLGGEIRSAHATPTTEFWTPATIDVQPYKV